MLMRNFLFYTALMSACLGTTLAMADDALIVGRPNSYGVGGATQNYGVGGWKPDYNKKPAVNESTPPVTAKPETPTLQGDSNCGVAKSTPSQPGQRPGCE